MISFRNTIAATATAFALMAPMAATSHANSAYDGFKRSHDHAVHKRAKSNRSKNFRAYKPRDNNVRYAKYHPDRSLRTPRIDYRIANQKRRIRRGRNTGRLTRIEAVRLRGHLLTIRSVRGFARIDGRVTRKERRRMNAMLDKNSKRIRRLASNSRIGRGRY